MEHPPPVTCGIATLYSNQDRDVSQVTASAAPRSGTVYSSQPQRLLDLRELAGPRIMGP